MSRLQLQLQLHRAANETPSSFSLFNLISVLSSSWEHLQLQLQLGSPCACPDSLPVPFLSPPIPSYSLMPSAIVTLSSSVLRLHAQFQLQLQSRLHLWLHPQLHPRLHSRPCLVLCSPQSQPYYVVLSAFDYFLSALHAQLRSFCCSSYFSPRCCCCCLFSISTPPGVTNDVPAKRTTTPTATCHLSWPFSPPPSPLLCPSVVRLFSLWYDVNNEIIWFFSCLP